MANKNERICLVGIVKMEEKFLDEWLVYHRMLGIDRFFLYDDDLSHPLQYFLEPHFDYVTVINWIRGPRKQVSNQIEAYRHAMDNHIADFDWVIYLDADEFIVLHQHETIPLFLAGYGNFSAVSLNWHMFGHNGYYDDPPGLITASLTRRMAEPDKWVKTFTRTQDIETVESAHYCKLKPGRMQANANENTDLTAGRPVQTPIARINHYHCRSFLTWMKRAERGDIHFDEFNTSHINFWRRSREGVLRKFIEFNAVSLNETEDFYMLKYKQAIQDQITKLRSPLRS